MELAATLPGGYWHRGRRYRRAVLRPLAGADEVFLLDAGRTLAPARRTTALLARCLERLGPLRRVTAETVRGLTAGDREALLLQLRRLTLGERMDCVLRCPVTECGERLDLELRVSELLLPPDPGSRERYETTVGEDGAAFEVRFRLPTGADQEAAADLAGADPGAAAALVLRRCVERVSAGDGALPASRWPPAVAREIPARMAELDPQAEIELRLTCPACGHPFSALLDAGAFLFQELAGRGRDLYREVHLLALHYHWSEAEILGLTPARRWLYLDLLAEEPGAGRSR